MATLQTDSKRAPGLDGLSATLDRGKLRFKLDSGVTVMYLERTSRDGSPGLRIGLPCDVAGESHHLQFIFEPHRLCVMLVPDAAPRGTTERHIWRTDIRVRTILRYLRQRAGHLVALHEIIKRYARLIDVKGAELFGVLVDGPFVSPDSLGNLDGRDREDGGSDFVMRPPALMRLDDFRRCAGRVGALLQLDPNSAVTVSYLLSAAADGTVIGLPVAAIRELIALIFRALGAPLSSIFGMTKSELLAVREDVARQCIDAITNLPSRVLGAQGRA